MPLNKETNLSLKVGRNLRGLVANMLNCDLMVNEFELWSRYYVHFWINPFGNAMNSLYPPSYGLNSITAVLQHGEHLHQMTFGSPSTTVANLLFYWGKRSAFFLPLFSGFSRPTVVVLIWVKSNYLIFYYTGNYLTVCKQMTNV